MKQYFLNVIYDSKKDFYRKAIIIEENGVKKLQSYETVVAYINDGKAFVNGDYSVTTLRHIKEFLKQNGFKAETKAQILNDYLIETEEN